MFNFGTTKVIQETLGDTEDVAKDHWGLRRSTEVFSLAHMAENWERRCKRMFADIHFTHQHSLLTSLVSKISLVLFVRLDLVYLIAAHQNNLTDF